MSEEAEVIDQAGQKVLTGGAEKPAWQDEEFMGKVQKAIDGKLSLGDAGQEKLLAKIKESIQVVQNIKAAMQKAQQQIQEASLQAERAEGQTQAYLSVLREMQSTG